MKKKKTYKWNGYNFSLSELAKLCHLTPSAMHYRLKKYPAEIAMQPKTSQKGGAIKKRYAFDGGIYTLDELAEKSGININTLRCRLFLGWSVERAMTEKVNHNLARRKNLNLMEKTYADSTRKNESATPRDDGGVESDH